jgi:diguanylate cyclase (GGDEF)-like protein/PAS domain S-box-containing protein
MSPKKIPQPGKNKLLGKDTLRLLFASHPIPMFVVDLKTLAFLDVNNAALKKYGYTRDEFLRLTVREIRAAGRSGEQRHSRKNGEIMDMEVTARPFEIEGQKVILIMAQDITHRKLAEREALESKSTAERYLNIAAEIIVALDRDGNITRLNESGHQLLGYDTTELIGKNWFDTCTPEEERGEIHQIFEMLKSGEIQNLEAHENSVITKSGERKMMLWHNSILRDQNGEFEGTLSSGEDITNRMEIQKTLRIALAKYKVLFECFPLGVTISDEAGNILESNPTAAKFLAVPRDEHVQRSIDGAEWRIIRPDGTSMPPDEYASVQALKEKRLIENVEMGIIKPDRSVIWLSVNAAPLPTEGYGVVVTYGDITARKQAEEALKESEWRNRIVSELTTDYIFVVDVERNGTIKLKWASDNMTRVTGRTVEEAATSDLWGKIIHPDDNERFFGFLNHTISTAETGELECRTFYKNGEERWVHIFASTQTGNGDKLMTIVGAIDDITERKRAEKALENANAELKSALEREKKLAHTDMLTGVNNRRNLYELATHEFEVAARYRQPLSVMMFDLDYFKKVNDTFGHIVGDQMLVFVTKAACAELRSADAIGRYGGEEFVILLPMTTAQRAYSLAERIRENAAKIRVPTPIGDASVTISLGIVEMKHGVEQDRSIDDLIRRADQAMYTAKQSGRNCVIISE